MSDFEKEWYGRYMDNTVSIITLQRLVSAGKISKELVDAWIQERKEKFGE